MIAPQTLLETHHIGGGIVAVIDASMHDRPYKRVAEMDEDLQQIQPLNERHSAYNDELFRPMRAWGTK
jgi:hypothetical protein